MQSFCALAESDAGGASREEPPMIESILFIAAAVATIAGFVLEVWREMKSRTRADDEGGKKKTGSCNYRS